MQRNEWSVKYNGAELLVAAQEKLKFHEGRETWWKDKKDECLTRLKTEGVNVSETIVDELVKSGYNTVANAHFGRYGPSVELDEKMVADLREAAGKVDEHKAKIKEFSAWVAMLERDPRETFYAAIDDYTFFFGK